MAALRTNRALDFLFQRSIGSGAHPRGRLLAIYRNTRRALAAVLAAGSALTVIAAVAEVMAAWRQDVKQESWEVVRGAVEIGQTQASADVATYALGAPGPPPDVLPAYTAMQATVDRQYTQIMAQVALGADVGVILGDGVRVGMLTPGPVVLDLGRLMVGVAVASYVGGVVLGAKAEPSRYRKQVVATIDAVTTECCLMAHGQVQDMDADFQLDGEPRYASRLQWTPFHFNCRSSIALVLREEADDDLTQQMKKAAKDELAAREPKDKRESIWPSHARSKRT